MAPLSSHSSCQDILQLEYGARLQSFYVSYLGGDLSLVDEVCTLRGFQEQLAVRAPDDPRRLFGEVVEASSSTSTQLANLFATVSKRLANQEEMLARIHESLEHDRARVNRSVSQRLLDADVKNKNCYPRGQSKGPHTCNAA